MLTEKEISNMEITDFGLNRLGIEGLQLVIYENNERYCAKELLLLPNQICSEHKHPPRKNNPGKKETFRCRYGDVWLYVEGDPLKEGKRFLSKVDERYYTAGKEIHLQPGEQYTILPDTFHWFVAGEEGAVVSEFSSSSDDASDIFRDPRVKRI